MEGYLLGAYMGLEGKEEGTSKKKKIIFKNKCDRIICTMKIYEINVKLRVCDTLKPDASRDID